MLFVSQVMPDGRVVHVAGGDDRVWAVGVKIGLPGVRVDAASKMDGQEPGGEGPDE